MIEQFQQFLASQPHAMSASSQIGLSSNLSGVSSSSWILDYGASNHMSHNLSSFTSLIPKVYVLVMNASGTPIPLQVVGSFITPSLSLSNVYHIPSLTLNLASVGQICDNGGEYTSHAFKELLSLDGTIYQTSCIDTPEQNGIAERKHRHILKTARSLIPISHNSGLSPYERLYSCLPDYSSLRVFGSTSFVLLPHVQRSKLTSRSAICVFLGYGARQKGYRCFDPVSHKLYVSRHVVFLEHIPYFTIPDRFHSISMHDLFCIDPFTVDDNEVPPAKNPNTPIGPLNYSP
ncbi:uncharacterized protein LOC126664688 [Mercurialis annua]|uniref:uncharacterized protein LOC126664688 n=1 Tax=Mercurialis annua TaxID=3986 RepID=UPI00215E8171|nr:uncharacterized protein LOC126664688 [Mercurialis annua]